MSKKFVKSMSYITLFPIITEEYSARFRVLDVFKNCSNSEILHRVIITQYEKPRGFTKFKTLGYVGKVCQIHPTFLDLVLEDDFVPILASLGYTKSGQELNINADYLATAVASALKADRLILMTDVPGVLENKQVLDVLRVAEVQEKIDRGIISGGMIPKIQAAVETVLAGVGQVVIGDNLNTGTIIKE